MFVCSQMEEEVERLRTAVEEEKEQRKREMKRMRDALEEVKEEKDKEVASLWSAIKRLSAGQNVVLPASVAATSPGPDSETDLFPNMFPEGDASPTGDILQQLLGGDVDLEGVEEKTNPVATGTWSGLSVPGLDVPPPDVGKEAAGAAPSGPTVSVTWDNLQIPGTNEGRLVQASAAPGGTPKVGVKKRQSSAATGGTPKAKPQVNEREAAPRALGTAGGTPARGCFLIGDSLVHRGRFGTRDTTWDLEVWSVPGGTWANMADHLPGKVEEWARLAEDAGGNPSAVLIWLGGNDAYPRRWAIGDIDDELSRRIKNTVATVRRRFDVYLVGPVPRPRIDHNEVWEATPAFRLERRLADMARAAEDDELEGTGRVRMVAMGRRLCTRKRGGAAGVDEYRVDSRWFTNDGVHLTAAAYRRLSDRFPWWLRCSGWWGEV